MRGMGLFDFVQEHDGIGLLPNPLGELAAFVAADIAHCRADEAVDAALVFVFAHIQREERFFAAEHEVRQYARQLGLADAGGAQEQKGADGAARVFQADAGGFDGAADQLHGFFLADQALAEVLDHIRVAQAFVSAQLGHGNAGHLAGDQGDIFDVQLGVVVFGLEGQVRLLAHIDHGGSTVQQLFGALRQGVDGEITLRHARRHLERVVVYRNLVIGFQMRGDHFEDAHGFIQRRLVDADDLAILHDGADVLDARLEFLQAGRADDDWIVAEKAFCTSDVALLKSALMGPPKKR